MPKPKYHYAVLARLRVGTRWHFCCSPYQSHAIAGIEKLSDTMEVMRCVEITKEQHDIGKSRTGHGGLSLGAVRVRARTAAV